MHSEVSGPTAAVCGFFGVALAVAGAIVLGLFALSVLSVVETPHSFASALRFLGLALANPLAVAVGQREDRNRGIDRRGRIFRASLTMLGVAAIQVVAGALLWSAA